MHRAQETQKRRQLEAKSQNQTSSTDTDSTTTPTKFINESKWIIKKNLKSADKIAPAIESKEKLAKKRRRIVYEGDRPQQLSVSGRQTFDGSETKNSQAAYDRDEIKELEARYSKSNRFAVLERQERE